MLKNEPSFASLLVKPSPAMHCGHGWIIGQDGKRWHPSRSQAELLNELTSKKGAKKGCNSQLIASAIALFTKVKATRLMKVSCFVVTHPYRVTGAIISRCWMEPHSGVNKLKK
ncbi:phage filamentation protein Fil family protein [Enterobacter hormaechei]